MIVSNFPLSAMFSRNNKNIYLSQEFQPYVKLENVLDKINLLTEENIIVSCEPYINNNGFSSNFHEDNTRTVVKEEILSEHFEDVASEEALSCPEGHVTIKSEIEDDNFEHFSSQEHPLTRLVTTIVNTRGEIVIENNVTATSLEQNNVTTTSLEQNSEGLSSLDLHLSPDDADNDEIHPTIDHQTDYTTQTSSEHLSEEIDLSLDTSVLSDAPSSNRTTSPTGHNMSQDMFAESQEGNSQVNALKPISKRTRSSTRCPSSSSDIADNRERQDEWNSQELSEVSQRLMLRTKQAKRLIMEVIRKRQMEDETLDAFKKRLRRM